MVRPRQYRVPQLAQVSVTASPIDGRTTSHRISSEACDGGQGRNEATDLATSPDSDQDEEDEEEEEEEEEEEDDANQENIFLVHSGVPGVKNSESSNSNNMASRYVMVLYRC
ncbi:hypothetical protein Pcinc_024579 [Petrolisthes cinctipes]|uniref:Uncharacterized protein n=1 Tax=Petrolisthes cinctipes TaxID=88211 RepID=A0AAE1FAB6_PETCI|nr:hypothetical protein Pcinc_024579 [Petrolisthes cinctipes]